MQMPLPYSLNICANKFRDVMVTPDSEISGVTGYAIYAVWHGSRFSKSFKIMVKASWRAVGEHLSRTGVKSLLKILLTVVKA